MTMTVTCHVMCSIRFERSYFVFQVSQSLAAQRFLEESASQLTYHGLCELGTKMNEGELAVFFRNNHFSTIYKLKTVNKNEEYKY